jgi:uncharacterized protein YukE
LQQALDDALARNWNRDGIIEYAQANQWDKRVMQLLRAFDRIMKPATMREGLTVK